MLLLAAGKQGNDLGEDVQEFINFSCRFFDVFTFVIAKSALPKWFSVWHSKYFSYNLSISLYSRHNHTQIPVMWEPMYVLLTHMRLKECFKENGDPIFFSLVYHVTKYVSYICILLLIRGVSCFCGAWGQWLLKVDQDQFLLKTFKGRSPVVSKFHLS